jgi:hypothetical protein
MTIKAAIWLWRIASPPVSPVFIGSRIRVTSGAGNSVDVVRVRRDWSR